MPSAKKPVPNQPPVGARKPAVEARRPAPPWLVLICVAAVALAAVIPYLNSLHGELFFDNESIILKNWIVNSKTTLSVIFSVNYWEGTDSIPSNLYRPLTILSYHLQYPESAEDNPDNKIDPTPYHVFNLVLHAGNALLAFLVIWRLARVAKQFGGDRLNVLMAAFGAALFAAHPIATEDVTNVVGRADLFVMFFLLCGLLLHISASTRTGMAATALYLAALPLIALAMLSKENAIAIVPIFAAFDILFLFPRRKGGPRSPSGHCEGLRFPTHVTSSSSPCGSLRDTLY